MLCALWILFGAANLPAAERPAVSGFYKNLLSFTTVEDSFGNLGLTDKEWAIDDFQRLRLKLDYAPVEAFAVQAHYELRFLIGDTERIRNRATSQPQASPLGASLFLPGRSRFLDLESNLSRDSNRRLTHDLDRLNARWVTETSEWIVGRQAVSWGTGLIWTPTDLFAGFSPTEIDRDEKLGVDVVRLLWTPRPDSFLDLVGEPLDENGPYNLDTDDSSLALRAGTHVGEYDLTLLGGWVAGDVTAGGDWSGYLGNAGFRGEGVFTAVSEAEERDYFRGLLSLDYGFARAWNPTMAVEYFYNGLGAGDSDAYLSRLAEASVQRAFQRGNAFNLGRHYLGQSLGLTPSALWGLQATTLLNLEDGSAQEFATARRSLFDNIDLVVGATVGLGGPGTEFGGFSVQQAGVEFENTDLLFAFLKAYF